MLFSGRFSLRESSILWRVPGAAQRECNEWCAADTDLGFTRDRRSNARKSGKPDLRGSFRSLAVPDQQCSVPRNIFRRLRKGVRVRSTPHCIRDTSTAGTPARQTSRPGVAAAVEEAVFVVVRGGLAVRLDGADLGERGLHRGALVDGVEPAR